MNDYEDEAVEDEGKITRELELNEVLSFAMGLYAEKLPQLFAPFLIAALISGVSAEIQNFSLYSFYLQPLLIQFWNFDKFLLGMLLTIVAWVLFTLAGGFCVKLTVDFVEYGKTRIFQSFRFTLRKFPMLLLAGIINGFLISIGLLLLIIPGIILAILLSLVVPVIVVEEEGLLGSFSRSVTLIRERWIKTFLLLFTLGIIISVFMLVGLTLGYVFETYQFIVMNITSAFVQPICPIALTLHYYSMYAKEKQPQQ